MRLLTIILFAFLLVACGPPPITEGTVINLEYDEAETRTESVPGRETCTGKGTKRRCTRGPSGTRTVHEEEEWKVTFEGPNEEGVTDQRTVEISQEVFNSLEIGDFYEVPGE